MERLAQDTGGADFDAGKVEVFAADGDVADEPALLRQKRERHARLVRLGVYLNIGVSSRCIEAGDAGPDVRHPQRNVHLERQNLVQFLGFERLADGFELDVGNLHPLETRRLGVNWTELRGRQKE